MNALDTLATPDIGDVVSSLMDRVYGLEQAISNPAIVALTPSNLVVTTIVVDGVTLSTVISPPGVPTYTPGTFFGDIYVDVAWAAPGDGSAVAYELTYAKRNTGGTYQTPNFLRTGSTNIRVSGLDPNSIYGFSLVAISRIGQASTPQPSSGFTNVSTAADATIPAVPTGLTLHVAPGGLLVTWNENAEVDVANGKGIYELQVDTVNTFNSANLIDQKVNGTISAITGLNPSSTYYARIQAIDASNNPSGWSAVQNTATGSVTSDGSPPSGAVTPSVLGGPGYLMVKWAAISNSDPMTYDIYASTASGTRGNLQVNVGGSNFIMRQLDGVNLAYGTTYYITVIARDRDGAGPASAQASGSMVKINGAADITAGSITAASGIIASLDAGTITTGTLNASLITVTNLSASSITTGTLNASTVSVINLNAGNITAGTLSAARIGTRSLSADVLVTSNLTATTITLAGGAFQIGNPLGGAGTSGLLINSQGIRQYLNGAVTSMWDVGGTATFAGALSGATGTFSGALSAATGSFTGSILVGSSFPTSLYSVNAIINSNMEDIDGSGNLLSWTTFATTGGTPGNFSADGFQVMSGTYSMLLQSFSNTSGIGVSSNPIAVNDNELWDISADFKYRAGGNIASRPMYVRVRFYTDAAATVAIAGTPAAAINTQVLDLNGTVEDSSPATFTAAGITDLLSGWTPPAYNTNYKVVGQVAVPVGVNAKSMRLIVYLWSSGTADATLAKLNFDNVVAKRALDTSYVNNGVITGGTIQTALAGSRIVIKGGVTNQISFFGNDGTRDGYLQVIGDTPTSTFGQLRLAPPVIFNTAGGSPAARLTLDEFGTFTMFGGGASNTVGLQIGNLRLGGKKLQYAGNATGIEADGTNMYYRATGAAGASGGHRFMDLAESGYATIQYGGTNNASDANLKDNVVPLNIDALSSLRGLKPVKFKWKHSGADDQGFVAQDVRLVMPDAVVVMDEDGTLGLSGNVMNTAIVRAIQQVADTLDAIDKRISKLEKAKA